jgi:hypothetical protein
MTAREHLEKTLKGTPEQDVSKGIQTYLDKRHVYNDRLNSGMVRVLKNYRQKDGTFKKFETWLHLCKKGTPDRFFILRGHIYFVEVKKFGKRPSPEQIERHQELRKAGAFVIVADSVASFMKQFEDIEPLKI